MSVSKKALQKSWFNWFMYNLAASNFARLEGTTFGYSMTPVLEELYKNDPEEFKRSLARHVTFYNTEPHIGALVNGFVCGMEEERANKKDVSEEMIQSMKIGMMGPLAGIGDSIIPGIFIPLLLSIGMGISSEGSILGPLFYIFTFIPLMIGFTYYLFFQGYKTGKSSIGALVGAKAKAATDALVILGITVMGALAASFVNITIVFKYGTQVDGTPLIDFQYLLDLIYPHILSLLLVPLLVKLIRKGMSVIKLMIILFIIVFVFVIVGIL